MESLDKCKITPFCTQQELAINSYLHLAGKKQILERFAFYPSEWYLFSLDDDAEIVYQLEERDKLIQENSL